MEIRDRMKKSEFWGAMILLGLHVVLFPVLLNLYAFKLQKYFSVAQLNFMYYSLSTVLVFAYLGRFLRRSFDVLLDNILRCLKYFALAWLVYYGLALVVSPLLGLINAADVNANDENVLTMLDSERGVVMAMTVFLAPLVEECIFRGGLFCGLQDKSRVLAYGVSIAAFCIYHVWQYALINMDLAYLIYALQYVPAAVALCWCYDKSGSIWTSIAFHMAFNFMSLKLVM